MKYDKVKKTPSQILSLTGFRLSEFDALLPCFKGQWDEYYRCLTLAGKPRQRQSYNRKTSLLPLASDKLLFILCYLKNNPLQDYHAATFGMTQPQCNVWVHRLSEILLRTLKSLGELPDRNSFRMIHLAEKCENVLLDGTERPIQRPQENEVQKSCYSGKKNS